MSNPNIDVSNGTCYTAAGQKLGPEFIPCGNSAYGYQTCCGAGDNCLADLACFGIHGSGYGSYLNYFAGCTDPSYKDASCPKKVVDQPWVALTLCDNSDGTWAICSQQGNPSTLQPGSYCSCTNAASATVAFKDSTSLANIASLPQSVGQTISFFNGHSPTAASLPTAGGAGGGSGSSAADSSSATDGSSTSAQGSSKSAPGSSTATSASTLPGGSVVTVTTVVRSSPTDQSGSTGAQGSSSGKLGTGAIVGIVVGAVAAILLFILLGFLLLRRRRRRRALQSGIESDGTKVSKPRDSDISTSPSTLVRPKTPPMPEADGVPVAEVNGRPADPWALRSELDGKRVFPKTQPNPTSAFRNSTRTESEALPPLAELPGSEVQPRQGTAPRLVEDAMVAPLNLRPKNTGAGQAVPNERSSSEMP